MKTVKIFRFVPGKGAFWQEYGVTVEADEMVLTILHRIRETLDPSLAYRSSCRSAVCGSCAMMINGKPGLACHTRINELKGDVITLAPLAGLLVIKDLVTDLAPFWNNFKKVMPWLEEAPNSDKMVITSKVTDLQEEICACILCASCFAACPEASAKRSYLGPHALMEGFRFLQDPRDMATAKRLDILAGSDGAWGCDGAFGCIGACPWDVAPVNYVAKVRTLATKVKLGMMKADDCCELRDAGGDKK